MTETAAAILQSHGGTKKIEGNQIIDEIVKLL